MRDSKPLVSAVMLTHGRSEMVVRAVNSFGSQTYERKEIVWFDNAGDRSIGRLRNEANKLRASGDIIIHWDSDDWSHPSRIAEQVALLQSSGAECVGYDEVLFWREWCMQSADQEAWLYRSQLRDYAIGTSMCYWRETWQRNPFPDRSEGCDDLYWHTGRRVKIASVSAIVAGSTHCDTCKMAHPPRMIASIHGGNTCAKIDASVCEWRRAPEWDEYCRREMAL